MNINPISKPLTDYHELVTSSFYNFRDGTALDVAKRVAIIATAPIAYLALAFLYLAFQTYNFFVASATPAISLASVIEEIHESIFSKIRTIAKDIQSDNQGRIVWSNRQIRSAQVFINYADATVPSAIQRDYILTFTKQNYVLSLDNGGRVDYLNDNALKNRMDPIITDLEKVVKNPDYTFRLLVLVKDNDGFISYAKDEMSRKGSAYVRKPEMILGTPARAVHKVCESLLKDMGRQKTPDFNVWLG